MNDNYKLFKKRYNNRINNFFKYIINENNYITFILYGYDDNSENILKLKNILKHFKTKISKFKIWILFLPYHLEGVINGYELMNVPNDEKILDLNLK